MRYAVLAAAALAAFSLVVGDAASMRHTPLGQELAPDGEVAWIAGRPNDVAVSPDGRFIAVKSTHGVDVFAASDHRHKGQVSTIGLGFGPKTLGGGGSFGLAWMPDSSALWVSNSYARLSEVLISPDGVASWGRVVKLEVTKAGQAPFTAPTGIAVDQRASVAYVALAAANAVAVVDLTKAAELARIPVGVAPVGVALVRGRLFVSNQGAAAGRGTPAALTAPSSDDQVVTDVRGVARGGTISVIDVGARRVVASVRTPAGIGMLAASRDGSTVFAASPTSGAVLALDSASLRIRALPLGGALPGASPNFVLPAGDHDAWVTLGGENRVVDLDVGGGRVRGGLATNWYPSAAALAPDGTLVVAAMKGDGSSGLTHGFPALVFTKRAGGYSAYDWAGTVQFIAQPRARMHATAPAHRGADVALPPIDHVVYIIKENRSYDEVFGDVREGRGDARLCEFCTVTPNHHRLARDYVLLDGFHVNGMLSADGHAWTSQDDAVDYIERNTGGFTRSYPSDGTDPLAYSSGGFIWDRVLDAGLTFRDYGEFTQSAPPLKPASATWSDFYRDWLRHEHKVGFTHHVDIARLRPHVVPSYPAYDLRIPDQIRADAFIADMRAQWARGTMPAFAQVQLGNDHTSGTAAGMPTPKAAMADNDLALGRIVEALTHGPFWKRTLVIVIEDDAQSGVDHLDAHRSVALVISPYTRGRGVDSRFYNQSSFVRLIERALHVAPMSIHDVEASDAGRILGPRADYTPYAALPAAHALDEFNAKASAPKTTAELTTPDRADPQELAAEIWRATR